MDLQQKPVDEKTPSLKVIPTIYPTSGPIEKQMERFWDAGDEFEMIDIPLEPPNPSLVLLDQLGPSPFERGGFPLIGFLATTYDKVSRYALERG